ncbi:hypothetical protein, partial [Paraburkholderia tuberum]|uniref:hypothetical protein n=1 Tax=Paraburkholderia tuberum TaxID=157910 RepID=UPI001ABC28D4
ETKLAGAIQSSGNAGYVIRTSGVVGGRRGQPRLLPDCGTGALRGDARRLTKLAESTKIADMNCLDIRIALIISIIHRMVG